MTNWSLLGERIKRPTSEAEAAGLHEVEQYPYTGLVTQQFDTGLPPDIDVRQQTQQEFDEERLQIVFEYLVQRAAIFSEQARSQAMPVRRVIDTRYGDQRSIPVFTLIEDVDVLGYQITDTLDLGKWDERGLTVAPSISRKYALAVSADPAMKGELLYLEQIISDQEGEPFSVSDRSARDDSIFRPGTTLSAAELCRRVDQRLEDEYQKLADKRSNEARQNGNSLLRPPIYYTSYLLA